MQLIGFSSVFLRIRKSASPPAGKLFFTVFNIPRLELGCPGGRTGRDRESCLGKIRHLVRLKIKKCYKGFKSGVAEGCNLFW